MSGKYKKLKKDIAVCPYPVFGLRKSVYDLEYVDHYEEKGWFTISYQSSNRQPYSFSGRNVHTLYLGSSIYVHERFISVIHDISLNFYVEEVIRGKMVFEEDHRIWWYYRAPFRLDIGFDVEGIPFEGSIMHYPAPLDMAAWCFSCPEPHHYHIDGRAFGLSYEEVIGVISSLGKLK
jgi:hypothetical protein